MSEAHADSVAVATDAAAMAQCVGCGAYTTDRRTILARLTCQGCGRTGWWTRCFAEPRADARIFDTDPTDIADRTPGRLDPVLAWRAMPRAARERIGAAAIAASVGRVGMDLMDEHEAWHEIARLTGESLIDQYVRQFALTHHTSLPLVDLVPLGFRQCRACGCTDDFACETGCHWVAEDLCSNCSPKAAV